MPLKSGLSSQKAISRTTISSRYLGAPGAGRFQTTRINTGNPPNFIPVDEPGLAVGTGVAALASAVAIPGTIVRSAFASRRKNRKIGYPSDSDVLTAAAAASQQGGKESAAKAVMKPRARRLMVGRATVRQTRSISSRKQAPPTGRTSSGKAFNPTPAPAYGQGTSPVCTSKTCARRRFSYLRKACCAHRMPIFAFSL